MWGKKKKGKQAANGAKSYDHDAAFEDGLSGSRNGSRYNSNNGYDDNNRGSYGNNARNNNSYNNNNTNNSYNDYDRRNNSYNNNSRSKNHRGGHDWDEGNRDDDTNTRRWKANKRGISVGDGNKDSQRGGGSRSRSRTPEDIKKMVSRNRRLSGDYSRFNKDSDESDSDDSYNSDDSNSDDDSSSVRDSDSSDDDDDSSDSRGPRSRSRNTKSPGRFPSDDSLSDMSESSGNDSDFDGFEDLKLSGSAVLAKEGQEERLRLTGSTGNQFGTAWFTKKKDMSSGFEIKFTFIFSEASNPPGEGIAFVIQNSKAGVNALGDVAGGIGYAGIERSVAIELDTHQNGDLDDPNDNHISVQTRGPNPNSAHHQYSIACESRNVPRLVDGTRHTCRVVYSPHGRRGSLLVYLDDMRKPLVRASLNIHKFAPAAYLGFTGATGAVWAKQDIIHFKFRHGVPDDIDDADDSGSSSDEYESDGSAPWNQSESDSDSDDSSSAADSSSSSGGGGGGGDSSSSEADSDDTSSSDGSSDESSGYDSSDYDSSSDQGFTHSRRGRNASGYDRNPGRGAGGSNNVYSGPHAARRDRPPTPPSGGCGFAMFCGRKVVKCGRTPASALKPPLVRGATPAGRKGKGRLSYRPSQRHPDARYSGGKPTHLGGPSTPRGGQRRNLPVDYKQMTPDPYAVDRHGTPSRRGGGGGGGGSRRSR